MHWFADIRWPLSFAITLHELGRNLMKMNKYVEAKNYSEKALQIKEIISPDLEFDRSVAVTLFQLGRCLLKMDRLEEAKNCFENSLRMNWRARIIRL